MVGHDGHRVFSTTLRLIRRFRNGIWQGHCCAAAWLRERGVWKINLMVRSENESRTLLRAPGLCGQSGPSFGKRIDVT